MSILIVSIRSIVHRPNTERSRIAIYDYEVFVRNIADITHLVVLIIIRIKFQNARDGKPVQFSHQMSRCVLVHDWLDELTRLE